jgi:hypothetical protein
MKEAVFRYLNTKVFVDTFSSTNSSRYLNRVKRLLCECNIRIVNNNKVIACHSNYRKKVKRTHRRMRLELYFGVIMTMFEILQVPKSSLVKGCFYSDSLSLF